MNAEAVPALHMELIPTDKLWVNPARSQATEGMQNSRLAFHNVAEVTQDMNYSTWTKKSSLANVSLGLEVQVRGQSWV